MSSKDTKKKRKELYSQIHSTDNDNGDSIWDDSQSVMKDADTLNDGRTFDYECWVESGYTFLTYTIPPKGIEAYTKEEIVEYLIAQGLKIDLSRFPMEKIELVRDKIRIQIIMTCGEGSD